MHSFNKSLLRTLKIEFGIPTSRPLKEVNVNTRQRIEMGTVPYLGNNRTLFRK